MTFMESFKYFKRKDISLDFSTVIDPTKAGSEEFLRVKKCQVSQEEIPKYGLKSTELWKIYEFNHHPGLYLIKDIFTSIGHRYWTVKCLENYPKSPNKTNLSNIGQSRENFWSDLQETSNTSDYTKLRNSLRWVTLGYHHNWDTKVYSEENKASFPSDLKEMIDDFIAPVLGFSGFNSEAAIVNYYPPGSTLSGHTDHSEQDLQAPLFSISFGQSAIFLIGGPDKNDPASAVLLESGDCLVMTKESRLCYHAVPKILSKSVEKWNENSDNCSNSGHDHLRNNDFWRPFDQYIKECRINMNVRQVLPYGQTKLCR